MVFEVTFKAEWAGKRLLRVCIRAIRALEGFTP